MPRWAVDGLVWSSIFTVAFWIAGCESNHAPTSEPYHGQLYSVSAAACTPT